MGNIHESNGDSASVVGPGNPGWIASRRDLSVLEQLLRDQSWKGPNESQREAMVLSLTMMTLAPGGEQRVKVRATLALAKLLDQNLKIIDMLLRLKEQAAPAPEQHLHIHLGENERRAHVMALLEEGIRDGSIVPASEEAV